jgi:hypothetical protein
VTDDPYAAKNMIERLGGTVERRKRNAHVLGRALRPSDEGVMLQQTIRRGDELAAAQ